MLFRSLNTARPGFDGIKLGNNERGSGEDNEV